MQVVIQQKVKAVLNVSEQTKNENKDLLGSKKKKKSQLPLLGELCQMM